MNICCLKQLCKEKWCSKNMNPNSLGNQTKVNCLEVGNTEKDTQVYIHGCGEVENLRIYQNLSVEVTLPLEQEEAT